MSVTGTLRVLRLPARRGPGRMPPRPAERGFSVVGRPGERPAVEPDRRHEDATEVAAERTSFASHCGRAGERREIALREPQVAHRPDDPPVFDEECPVAG